MILVQLKKVTVAILIHIKSNEIKFAGKTKTIYHQNSVNILTYRLETSMDQNPLVSVIVINYNNREYLDKCLLSLSNQTLKDLEVIIVDDGSTDESVEFIENYIESNPKFKLIKQKNKGPGNARNTGIDHSTGQYIAFLDSDDFINPNTYLDMINAITESGSDTLIGNLRCFNGKRKWYLPYMKVLFSKDLPEVRHIKDFEELHVSPSACNKLFSSKLIKENNIRFREDLSVGEDLLFSQEALFKSNSTRVLNKTVLHYRIKEVGTSLIHKTDISFFRQLVDLQKAIVSLHESMNTVEYSKPIEDRQWDFFVNSILNKKKYLMETDFNILFDLGKEYIGLIKHKEIFDEKLMQNGLIYELLNNSDRDGFCLLFQILNDRNFSREVVKYDDEYYSYLARHFTQHKHRLKIKQFRCHQKLEFINLEDDHLTIKGSAWIGGLSTESLKKEMVIKNQNDEVVHVVTLSNLLRTDISYIEARNTINYDFAGYEYTFDFISSILIKGDYRFFLRLTKDSIVCEEPISSGVHMIKRRVSPYIDHGVKVHPYFKKNQLHIRLTQATVKTKIRYGIHTIKKAIQPLITFAKKRDKHSFLAYFLYLFLIPYYRKKGILIIGERRDTAQDNSYHVFKYIRTKYPKVPIYYVIEKNSEDWNRVVQFGHVIPFGSLKHTLYLIVAKKSINSYAEQPNMYTSEYKRILINNPLIGDREKIFLQHGVIGVSRVNHVLNKNRMRYTKFIVSSEFEKDHIVNEFGYDPFEVVASGLPRWDYLRNTSDGKKILLMPTWRNWNKTTEQLEDSEYWNRFMSFLNNKELHKLLEEYDMTLTFYPHYQTQLLMPEVKEFHPRIQTIYQGDVTVQELLCSHEILITDYSTVAFDFSYMEKPVMFYQFDRNRFYGEHYNEGPITEDKLFGTVVKTEDNLMNSLKGIIMNPESHIGLSKENPYLIKAQGYHTEKVVNEILGIV